MLETADLGNNCVWELCWKLLYRETTVFGNYSWELLYPETTVFGNYSGELLYPETTVFGNILIQKKNSM